MVNDIDQHFEINKFTTNVTIKPNLQVNDACDNDYTITT